MQNFSYLPDSGTFFVTQKTAGSVTPYETLIINRVDAHGSAFTRISAA